ncbi:hypothetical protein JCM6882_008506 [Rhodosporidiobolus microsporus]
MSATTPSDLQLPTSDEGLSPDVSAQVGKHLTTLRAQHHIGLKKAGAAVEMIGGQGKKYDEDEDEVDDDWFGVKEDDPSSRFVRLTTKVPQRAGTMIKRTIRGGRGHHHRHHSKKGGKLPDIVVEEEAAGDQFELEDDEGGAPFGTEVSTSTFSEGPLHASPTGSAESLLTLDLPFSGGGGLSTNSSRSQLPYGRAATQPPFTTLSTLPTLSELRSFDSTSSSSPSASAHSPSGTNTPTRTLSIDDSAPMHGVKRTTSRSTFRSGSHHRHRLHLPGRPKFSMRKKKTMEEKPDAAAAAAAGFDAQVMKGLLEAGVVKEEEEKSAVDVLYEHQRGLVVFGIPRFSSAALLQVDPSEWCDASLRPSPFTPHDHPCPPYWLWRDSEFMVCMSGDVDEEGWSYALRFRSHHWSGEPTFPYAFVRRRQWIRSRIYRPEPVVKAADLAAGTPSAAGSKVDVVGEFRDELAAEEGDEGEEDGGDKMGGEGKERGEDGPRRFPDLRSACRCLPLYTERRAAIFADSSSPNGGRGFLPFDYRNPFLSFSELKREAAATARGGGGFGEVVEGGARGGGEEKDLPWRDAVAEINYRRVVAVMKALGKIDRERLGLWRLWTGEKGRKKEQKEADDGASVREAGPEMEDVWDVVESRLDLLLPLFDYNLTRLSFLRLILSLHPSRAQSHRHEGYDLPCATQRAELEKSLAGRAGVSFYGGVEELVREFECAEGVEEEKAREREKKEKEEEERRRKSTMRRKKGKGRA